MRKKTKIAIIITLIPIPAPSSRPMCDVDLVEAERAVIVAETPDY